VALQAIKLFAAQKGIKIVAAQADIDIEALKTCINLLAKDEITIRADKIRIEAKTQLLISGGGSYARYTGGSIESGTTGPHVQHASSHSMLGPSSSSRPSLPDGLKPGKGQLELTHRYANNHGLKGANYKVTDSAGQVKTGKLDDKGFAAVSGLAPGGARIELGEDPRNPWDHSSYFGIPTWPPKKTDGPADATTAPANDMLAGLMKQASGAASTAGAAIGATALLAGGQLAKLASGAASVSAMADVARAVTSGNFAGIAKTAATSVANSLVGDMAGKTAARLPPGVVLPHTTV
jgi:type VI secretion system secreted protein VgrG